jgi:hypothetical protein
MNELILKRRKSILLSMVVVFGFIILMMISNLIIFLFEHNYNNNINNVNDSFKVLESIFHLSGNDGVYPATIGGRIMSFIVLGGFLALFVVFVIQIFNIFVSFGNPQDKKVIVEEINENQELEEEILKKQDEILEYEQTIMEKLDKLREDK